MTTTHRAVQFVQAEDLARCVAALPQKVLARAARTAQARQAARRFARSSRAQPQGHGHLIQRNRVPRVKRY